MIRILRSLRRDEGGASVIELALVAPVLATLLIGMVDCARAYSSKLQLEQAAQRAIEKVQSYQASESTYNTLKSEAAQAARDAGWTTASDSDVTVRYWLECNGATQANYDTTCPSGQMYARWITVDITEKFTPMFGTKYFPRANADGTYTLHGIAGLRTQ